MSDPYFVPVRFSGEGSGIEHLSWGQWELWEGMDRLDTWMPIGAVQPLPVGATVAGVASDLRFMMSRYQTMRTRLRFDPDGPKQVVFASGETTLEVVTADPADDPAKTAVEVERRYQETAYDFTSDWPVRMAVVCQHGVPTHQVFVVCHLVTDAGGATVIAGDLAARDPATGQAAGPPAEMQPLAQARWQRSPAGKRQRQTSLRYWEQQLHAIPARRFPASRHPRAPRYWQGGFSSPAAHLAMQAISTRTGADHAALLLTVFVVAVARLAGSNPVATRVIVDNRFRPGFAGVVGPLAQAGLLVVDLAGLTLDEALDRTRRRSMVGYKNAYFDAEQVYEAMARIGHERGEDIQLSCFVNDLRPQVRPDPAARVCPTPEQVRAALPHRTFRWQRQQDERLETLFLIVNPATDTLDLTVEIDTHHLDPADAETLLNGIEQVAVEAAFDPDAPARIGDRLESP